MDRHQSSESTESVVLRIVAVPTHHFQCPRTFKVRQRRTLRSVSSTLVPFEQGSPLRTRQPGSFGDWYIQTLACPNLLLSNNLL